VTSGRLQNKSRSARTAFFLRAKRCVLRLVRLGTHALAADRGQVQVTERAIETAALMLGSDKSRGYCLEMICAEFLAGASVDGNDPEILLQSISRYYQFLPRPQRETFLAAVTGRAL
jgi:hypothetical protein